MDIIYFLIQSIMYTFLRSTKVFVFILHVPSLLVERLFCEFEFVDANQWHNNIDLFGMIAHRDDHQYILTIDLQGYEHISKTTTHQLFNVQLALYKDTSLDAINICSFMECTKGWHDGQPILWGWDWRLQSMSPILFNLH